MLSSAAPPPSLRTLLRAGTSTRARRSVAVVASLLTACAEPGPVEPPGQSGASSSVGIAASHAAAGSAGFAPGRAIVRLTPGTDPAGVAEPEGASAVRELMADVWLFQVPEGAEVTVSDALGRNPNVAYAEPDYLRLLDDPLCPSCQRPSDGWFEWQWNMHNDGDVDYGLGLVFPTAKVDADIDWLEAFDYLGPSPAGAARIGILDTGVLGTHEDFCGKGILWKNFYDPNSLVPVDDHGHGTHVHGIAGACADNFGLGVVGVAYGANMEFVSGKVCDVNGQCLVSGIVEGIRWATDNGANSINMSFGDTQQSQAEADALAYAVANNVLPVCGAGNEASSVILFPAADPNCVAVTATDYGDELASYSSFGAQAEVAAPGGDLEDFLFASSLIFSTGNAFENDYIHNAGTSMAAPHVAGLAALLYALGVTDAVDIRNCLRNTADDLGPPGWDEQFGWGRVNMYQAVVNAGSCAGGGGGDNVPPTASFTVTCNGLDCDFDGSDSWDPDGSVTSHSWSFGDGATATGVTASHTYGEPGDFIATLTVTDNRGGQGASSQIVSVGRMHLGVLTASSEWMNGNRWRALLAVPVVGVDGQPVIGADVTASWSGSASGSATRSTDGSGTATFETSPIRGEGTVTFAVTDVTHSDFAYDPSLNAGGVTATAETPNVAPRAAFTESCGPLTCAFTDQSADDDGEIVAWAWEFGDGFGSVEQDPTHTYALSFFYFVTLTVTDDKGATDTVIKEIFVPPLDAGITLSATGYKSRGEKLVDLTWTGATGTEVEVYRSADPPFVTENDGAHTDVLGRTKESSFTYLVCEVGTNLCSNAVTVTF